MGANVGMYQGNINPYTVNSVRGANTIGDEGARTTGQTVSSRADGLGLPQVDTGTVRTDIPAPGELRGGIPGWINPATAQNDPRGTMANILRGQWQEFQGNTVPIIRQLEGMTTYGGNKGVVDQLKTEARNNAKAAFGSVVPNAQREAQSYGMALNPTTEGALERSSKLGMAAASVDGVNRANQYQQDLNRQIVAGSNLSALSK